MKIRVMPKDKCVEIAKIFFYGEEKTIDEMLVYLPDKVFGEEFEVIMAYGDFIVKAKGETGTWSIPSFFVECVTQENLQLRKELFRC